MLLRYPEPYCHRGVFLVDITDSARARTYLPVIRRTDSEAKPQPSSYFAQSSRFGAEILKQVTEIW